MRMASVIVPWYLEKKREVCTFIIKMFPFDYVCTNIVKIIITEIFNLSFQMEIEIFDFRGDIIILFISIRKKSRN